MQQIDKEMIVYGWLRWLFWVYGPIFDKGAQSYVSLQIPRSQVTTLGSRVSGLEFHLWEASRVLGLGPLKVLGLGSHFSNKTAKKEKIRSFLVLL